MRDTLTYDVRGHRLHCVVGGQITSVPVDPASARVWTWDRVQELRSGKSGASSGGDGRYVLTSVQHRARPRSAGRLSVSVAENAAFEVFDYPGSYAQRFDGVDKDGTRDGRVGGANVVNGLIMEGRAASGFDPGFTGGIFVATGIAAGDILIHRWQKSGLWRGLDIGVVFGWEELAARLGPAQRITVVIEI